MKYLFMMVTLFGLTACMSKIENKQPSIVLQVLDAKSLNHIDD